MRDFKVAIVCDWLTNMAGAERVIEVLVNIFPNAKVFTPLFNSEKIKFLTADRVETSYLQKIPGAKSRHQLFLMNYPSIFESYDLSDYDLVISSSHSCAKGVVTGVDTLHICYCHSPMRYVWDGSHEFVRTYPLPKFLKFFFPPLLKRMRIWDRLAADRVDFFLANSHLVQKRIKKYYQKDSEVLFPPVNLLKWQRKDLPRQDFYLAVGRMTPYKKFDLLVEAFNANGKQLKIAGCGPMLEKLKSRANSNIEFLGFVSDEKLRELYSEAKAFLFPQNEDFGVVPIEAMSCGAPVVAFRKGGALDTIVEDKTGVFFDSQDVQSLNQAILAFEKKKWNEKVIIKHAQSFGHDIFQKKLLSFIEEKWSNFR